MNSRLHQIRVVLKLVPFIGVNLAAQDLSKLAEQHLELRNRILVVGRDRLAVLDVDHKLMAASRVWTLEAELTQPTNEVSALTGIQPGQWWGRG